MVGVSEASSAPEMAATTAARSEKVSADPWVAATVSLKATATEPKSAEETALQWAPRLWRSAPGLGAETQRTRCGQGEPAGIERGLWDLHKRVRDASPQLHPRSRRKVVTREAASSPWAIVPKIKAARTSFGAPLESFEVREVRKCDTEFDSNPPFC